MVFTPPPRQLSLISDSLMPSPALPHLRQAGATGLVESGVTSCAEAVSVSKSRKKVA